MVLVTEPLYQLFSTAVRNRRLDSRPIWSRGRPDVSWSRGLRGGCGVRRAPRCRPRPRTSFAPRLSTRVGFFNRARPTYVDFAPARSTNVW